MLRIFFVVVVVAVSACKKEQPEDPNDFDFDYGVELSELTNNVIGEASGLAASINNPGLLWTHNDSGNAAEIFLVNEKTEIKMTCILKGVENRDWEDISVGPGPDGKKNYVYVADIGDNMAQYQYKVVYRFEEPVASDTNRVISIENFEKIVFELDERKDTETLMLDPVKKDLYVVSKREEPVVLYKLPFPQNTSDTTKAIRVATIPLTQIVGGDFSPDGYQILLKNYQNVFLWTRGKNESVEDVFQEEGKILPYAQEPQGEAITFARDGAGYFTISEKVKGERSFLKFYKRK
jgi:hypothetical protein